MTCEIKRFGVQEPKGWDGTKHHPVLQENDPNYIETPYYESDDNDDETECETASEYQDTDSDYQSSEENLVVKKIQYIRRKPNHSAYKIILTDETDFIPE